MSEFVEIAVWDDFDNQIFQWVIREYDPNATEWFHIHGILDNMAKMAYAAGAKVQYNSGPNLMAMPYLLRQVYSNMALQKIGDQWYRREFPTLQHGRIPDESGAWDIDALVNGLYLCATWYPGED
jgi:hypothetical protein